MDNANESDKILQPQLTWNLAKRKHADFENLHSQPWTRQKETDFANQNQTWTRTLTKKRQADFENLQKWTRTFANAETKAKRKAENF